eukprot:scaffold1878_cov258-Pinguiococcus_pyrenoidosus.AAC.14
MGTHLSPHRCCGPADMTTRVASSWHSFSRNLRRKSLPALAASSLREMCLRSTPTDPERKRLSSPKGPLHRRNHLRGPTCGANHLRHPLAQGTIFFVHRMKSSSFGCSKREPVFRSCLKAPFHQRSLAPLKIASRLLKNLVRLAQYH